MSDYRVVYNDGYLSGPHETAEAAFARLDQYHAQSNRVVELVPVERPDPKDYIIVRENDGVVISGMRRTLSDSNDVCRKWNQTYGEGYYMPMKLVPANDN